jgi:hypothetical protein
VAHMALHAPFGGLAAHLRTGEYFLPGGPRQFVDYSRTLSGVQNWITFDRSTGPPRLSTCARCVEHSQLSRSTKFACPGSIISAVTSEGTPETTALRPGTYPGSEIFVMIVWPSRDLVESFTFPAQRTKTRETAELR